MTKQHKRASRRVIVDTDAANRSDLEAQIEAKIEELHKTAFKIKAITDYERSLAIMEAVTTVTGLMTEEQFIFCTPVFDRYFHEVISIAPPGVLKANPEFVELAKLVHRAATAVTQAEHEFIRAARLEAKRSRRPVQGLEMEAPKCTRCGKRPRKFDNLCGRCAEETGERPKGRA